MHAIRVCSCCTIIVKLAAVVSDVWLHGSVCVRARSGAARPQSADPLLHDHGLSHVHMSTVSVIDDGAPFSESEVPSGGAAEEVHAASAKVEEGKAEEAGVEEEEATGQEVGERRSLVVSIPHYHRGSGQSVCSVDTASTSNERQAAGSTGGPYAAEGTGVHT